MSGNICIKDCQVVTSSGIWACNVNISDGIITGLTGTDQRDYSPDTMLIDGRGKLLLPGMIDCHTHIRAPGQPDNEDFVTGTAGAALGGITTILEMPIADKPVTSGQDIAYRQQLAARDSYVDFGFFGGAGLDSVEKLDEQAKSGAVAFKLFMSKPQLGREKELAGLWAEEEDDLRQVFRAVKKAGKPLAVHAEDGRIIRNEEAKGKLGIASHTPEAELEAVRCAVRLAGETGVRLVICHVSTPEALELISREKENGTSLFAECCPHYLLFSEEDAAHFGAYAKIKPPLRTRKAVEGLWRGLAEGKIDLISSDHAPYRPELKNRDMDRAPYGIPGIELSLRLMIDAAIRNQLKWESLVYLIAERPSFIYNICKKGRICIGMDADLVLVDPGASTTIDANALASRSGASALIYHGRKLLGDIDLVMLRGEIISAHNRLLGKPGYGKSILCKSSETK